MCRVLSPLIHVPGLESQIHSSFQLPANAQTKPQVDESLPPTWETQLVPTFSAIITQGLPVWPKGHQSAHRAAKRKSDYREPWTQLDRLDLCLVPSSTLTPLGSHAYHTGVPTGSEQAGCTVSGSIAGGTSHSTQSGPSPHSRGGSLSPCFPPQAQEIRCLGDTDLSVDSSALSIRY